VLWELLITWFILAVYFGGYTSVFNMGLFILLIGPLALLFSLCNMVSNERWLCGCGRKFNSNRGLSNHLKFYNNGCSKRVHIASSHIPPAQPFVHIAPPVEEMQEADEFIGDNPLIHDEPCDSVAQPEYDAHGNERSPANDHDAMFLKLAHDNNFTNATIDQALAMGRAGFKLGEVRYIVVQMPAPFARLSHSLKCNAQITIQLCTLLNCCRLHLHVPQMWKNFS